MNVSTLIFKTFFLLILVCPPIVFGSSKKEAIIEIYDSTTVAEYPNSKQKIVFDKPGTKKLTIKNHLDKNVNVGDILFVGDEFTAPIIKRGLSVQNPYNCSIIDPNSSCLMTITADLKASPTVDSKDEGVSLFLNYKIGGDEKIKFIQFRVKLNYNDDLQFEIRNIQFVEKRFQLDDNFSFNEGVWFDNGEFRYHGFAGELTIINSLITPVFIKDIMLVKNGKSVGRIICSTCKELKSGASCKTELTIDYKDRKKYDALPIYVTYDTDSRKDLVAVAAAIINPSQQSYDPEKTEIELMELINAAIGGYLLYKAIMLPNAILSSNNANLLTQVFIGILAGASFKAFGWIDDKFFRRDKSSSKNKFVSGALLHSLLAVDFCEDFAKKNGVPYEICAVVTIGCGLASTFNTGYAKSALFPNAIHRLPEQKTWLSPYTNDLKLAFDIIVMAGLRTFCKSNLAPHGGFVEIMRDALAVTSMICLNKGENCLFETTDGLPDFSRKNILPETEEDFCEPEETWSNKNSV